VCLPPSLASNFYPPVLHLWGSWDYRYAPPHPGNLYFVRFICLWNLVEKEEKSRNVFLK
jgi:hypothetical protein